MPDYQQLSRDEVLRLVLEKDQLTDEARLALEAEVARRGLSHDDFADFKSDEATALRERQKEIERATPRQTYKEFRGRKNYCHDARFRIEEFDTTLWIVGFWVPFVPLTSLRIRRKFRRWWNVCVSDQYRVIEGRPLDWEQILLTWIKTAAVLLLIWITLPFLLEHFVYRK
jgi:hypothetical protein